MSDNDFGECRHCGEPIMRFSFKEGKQWWHANVTRGAAEHPPGTEHIRAPAYRRCHADPKAPFAEPA
jgi:hypothetical protein